MTAIPKKLGSEYYRSFLTTQGQSFYDTMMKQLLRKDYSGISTFLVSDSPTAASDGFAAYKAIRDDHPEFFFLGFQSEFTRLGKLGKLKYPILYSSDVIQRVQYQMRKTVCNLVRGTAGLTVLERELLVYERIARRLSYDNHSDVRDHNIVGPILLNSGVCEGHNALLLLCLRRIGIPCIKVYGKTKSDGWHCWTVVWINGEPAHCDVTWDCHDNGTVWFNYLNLSDRQIEANHFSFKSNQVPRCLSEQYSYYQYKGLCVNSRSELWDQLKKASKLREPLLVHIAYRPKNDDLMN